MQTVKLVCPRCNQQETDGFWKSGFKQLYQKRLQKYQCKKCGHVFHLEG